MWYISTIISRFLSDDIIASELYKNQDGDWHALQYVGFDKTEYTQILQIERAN